MHRFALTGLFVAACCITAAGRTWTDRSGQFRTEASLLTVKNGRVYLERDDGRVVPVPLERMSVADLKYLATMPEYEADVAPLLAAATPAVGTKTSLAANTSASPSSAASRSSAAGRAAAKVVRTRIRGDAQPSGEVRRFQAELSGIKGLAFSPDGAMLAIGQSNSTLALVDLDSSQMLSVHENQRTLGGVSCMAFSPDGSRLLVGGQTGVIQVWGIDRRRQLVLQKDLKIHNSAVEAIVVSRDNRLALSGENRQARYWRTDSGAEMFGWEGFSQEVKGVYLTQRSEQAVVTDGALAALAELNRGQLLQTMPTRRGSSQSVAISPDGMHLAVNDTYAMQVWETTTGKMLPKFQDSEIQWAATFSPDGRYLLSAGNGRISVWSIESHQRVYQYTTAEQGYVHTLAFCPDNLHFAATCGPLGGTVQVFRLPDELQGR